MNLDNADFGLVLAEVEVEGEELRLIPLHDLHQLLTVALELVELAPRAEGQ
jgi:hypothetical protein